MTRVNIGLLFFLMAVLLPSLAHADDVPISLTHADSDILGRLKEKVAFNYFGIYRGSSVASPGAADQPKVDGTLDPNSPQSIESYVTTGYRLDANWTVGVQTHFFASSFGIPQVGGKAIQMQDPLLMISRANLVQSGGLTVKGLFFIEPGLAATDFLRSENLPLSVSPTLSVNFDVPHTRLSVGAYNYITGYLKGSDTVGPYRTYKVYIAPNAHYQFTETFSATLWVDLIQATRNSSSGFISGLNNPTADVEPGVAWEFIRGFKINPSINIYPKNPTLASTSFQAVIIGSIL